MFVFVLVAPLRGGRTEQNTEHEHEPNTYEQSEQ